MKIDHSFNMFMRILLYLALSACAGCVTVERPPLYIEGLSAAVFSPDGRLAAVADENRIIVFDAASMNKLMSFTGKYRYGTKNTLVFIDDTRIATTGMTARLSDEKSQAAIRIWDTKDQYAEPRLIALPELGRFAIALAWSAATGSIAVGGESGAVVMLEPDGTGKFKHKQLHGLDGPVLTLVFSQDGSLLAAGGVHPNVEIWEVQSLATFGQLPVRGPVYDLELIPGQKSLVVASDDLIVWKFLTDEELKAYENPSMAGDVVLKGAQYTAIAILFVISAYGGGVPGPPFTTDTEPDYGFCTRQVAVAPDGHSLVDVHPGLAKEKIRVIAIPSGEVIKSINPRGGHTCGIGFSPDGKALLIANQRVARLYDTSTWNYSDFKLD